MGGEIGTLALCESYFFRVNLLGAVRAAIADKPLNDRYRGALRRFLTQLDGVKSARCYFSGAEEKLAAAAPEAGEFTSILGALEAASEDRRDSLDEIQNTLMRTLRSLCDGQTVDKKDLHLSELVLDFLCSLLLDKVEARRVDTPDGQLSGALGS